MDAIPSDHIDHGRDERGAHIGQFVGGLRRGDHRQGQKKCGGGMSPHGWVCLLVTRGNDAINSPSVRCDGTFLFYS